MKVSCLWKPYHIAPHPSPHTTHPSLLTAPPILRSTTIRTKRSSMMSLLPYMVEWSQVVYVPRNLSPNSINSHYLCTGDSLVPRPCPTFRRFQYGKVGRVWYFSHVRWRNRQMAKICRTNRLRFAYCSTDYTLNTWCGKLPGTLALFAVLGPVHPHTI